mmetsp:Transcript_41270/g.80759  ORF Transcript_41270/g.80759 Transcript_41270/m.80759 type:complete len:250 (+) Transcript_41270:110-859(+)
MILALQHRIFVLASKGDAVAHRRPLVGDLESHAVQAQVRLRRRTHGLRKKLFRTFRLVPSQEGGKKPRFGIQRGRGRVEHRDGAERDPRSEVGVDREEKFFAEIRDVRHRRGAVHVDEAFWSRIGRPKNVVLNRSARKFFHRAADRLGGVGVDRIFDARRVGLIAQPAEEARPHGFGISNEKSHRVSLAAIIRQRHELKILLAAYVRFSRLLEVRSGICRKTELSQIVVIPGNSHGCKYIKAARLKLFG